MIDRKQHAYLATSANGVWFPTFLRRGQRRQRYLRRAIPTNWKDLKVGKFYLLRGGHLQRYIGEYKPCPGHKNKRDVANPCLAFRSVRNEYYDYANPSGYSAGFAEVLRELTTADRCFLNTRRASARARDLKEAALDAEFLLVALGITDQDTDGKAT